MTAQLGLCWTRSETPKTGFLTTRLKCPFSTPKMLAVITLKVQTNTSFHRESCLKMQVNDKQCRPSSDCSSRSDLGLKCLPRPFCQKTLGSLGPKCHDPIQCISDLTVVVSDQSNSILNNITHVLESLIYAILQTTKMKLRLCIHTV